MFEKRTIARVAAALALAAGAVTVSAATASAAAAPQDRHTGPWVAESAWFNPDGENGMNPDVAPAWFNPDVAPAWFNPDVAPAWFNPDVAPAWFNPDVAPAWFNPDGQNTMTSHVTPAIELEDPWVAPVQAGWPGIS